MKVIGFAGFSGSGKTTLIERLIVLFKERGLRVSVIKHAHEGFDIDRPGKDSHRFRSAGAFEMLIASNRRLALMREYEKEATPQIHHLLAEVYDGVDWVFVEGFKASDLLKIEVHRKDAGHPFRFEEDDFIVAISTDAPELLGGTTQRPVINLNEPQELAQWMLANADRFEYDAPNRM